MSRQTDDDDNTEEEEWPVHWQYRDMIFGSNARSSYTAGEHGCSAPCIITFKLQHGLVLIAA
jgi:hypothetical protein